MSAPILTKDVEVDTDALEESREAIYDKLVQV